MTMKRLEKIGNKVFFNIVPILGIVLLSLDAIALLAPILAHFGFDKVAHVIYYVYRFLCHQRPWRSIHLFDYQVAWCSRDTFIYLAMGLSAFFVKKFKIRGIRWYVPILVTLPFAIDGTTQLIAEIVAIYQNKLVFFYASTNFLRMLTGSIFGAGIGMWLFSMLEETIEVEANAKLQSKPETAKTGKPKMRLRNLKLFLAIILICFVSYLGIVQLWRITSKEYKPGDFLDHVRYFPGVNYEFTDRGGHGT